MGHFGQGNLTKNERAFNRCPAQGGHGGWRVPWVVQQDILKGSVKGMKGV
jgi:hypothetical protein